MIQLTDKARTELAKMLEEQPEMSLRLFIQGFG